MSWTRPTPRQRQLLLLLAAAVLLVAWVWVDNTQTEADQDVRNGDRDSSSSPDSGDAGEVDPASGLRWVSLASLPPEASDTVDLIDAGGPFPYDRDGVTFENREGILPDQQRGYYREYTVPTPGSDDRGARRIVTGSDDQFYWTEDHYDSFERIRR